LSAADEERRAWFRREILPLEPQLRAYARRFCRRGEAEVEDLVHETYARAIGYERWQEVDSASAFAMRILKNIALDGQRRTKIASFQAIEDFDRMGLADEAPDPEVTVLSRDELRKLREVVERLPDQVRRVFTLRKVYGLPHKEIAERLGLSVSTVEKHLAKGLRICSEELAREEGRQSVVSFGAAWASRRHRDGSR
jgi:RNA polymerase sigma-70 factor (ECF subfamily)